MKKLLRSKANFNVLAGFLSELLHEEITILEILESESNKEHEEDKYNRVDLLIRNSSGALVVIECKRPRNRIISYACSMPVLKSSPSISTAGETYRKAKGHLGKYRLFRSRAGR